MVTPGAGCLVLLQVDQRLQYHRTDTESLMDLYHQQRLLDQLNCDSAEYGVLAVRAYFNHDSLCVEVLSARDVIPLDPNGKLGSIRSEMPMSKRYRQAFVFRRLCGVDPKSNVENVSFC